MRKIKVIVFGNQQICIDCLKVLQKIKTVEVLCVVGSELPRDKKFGYPSVRVYCQKANIKFYNPDILDEDFFNFIKSLKPDLCFSIYFRKIFKSNFINLPRMGFINMHPSLLPSYRGPAPTMWALIKGEIETGLTMHYIDAGVDTGDIISQIVVKIPPNITGFDLNKLVMKKGVKLFKQQLPLILARKNKRKKQDGLRATYFGSFTSTTASIDWFDSKGLIRRRVNALTKPYGGAFSILNGKKITFWSVEVLRKNLQGAGSPGKITQIHKDGSFVVRTIDGFIKIREYEIEGVNERDKLKILNLGDRFDV